MSIQNGRFCHYCEQPKCKCTYRFCRAGEFGLQVQNTSRQTTMGEMRKQMAELSAYLDSQPAVWSISYTIIDPAKPIRKRKSRLANSKAGEGR